MDLSLTLVAEIFVHERLRLQVNNRYQPTCLPSLRRILASTWCWARSS